MIPDVGDLIRDRYRIKRILGQSQIGVTALADDERGGKPVALKILSLEKMRNWKQFDLFEREIRVLKNLEHPNIPTYVDSFHLEDRNLLGLAQLYVDGKNLEDSIREGLRFTEERVARFITVMLDILEYLQSFRPPIVHRDINPKNIVLGMSGEPHLVDFDSVHSASGGEPFGSDTAVGTFGYMPMDQIMGKITPAVDMYALGVTLIYVLTHKRPEELALRDSRLDYAPYLDVSPGLERFIGGLVEPAVERRIGDARSASAAFKSSAFEYGEEPANPFVFRKTYRKVTRTQSMTVQIEGDASAVDFYVDGRRVNAETLRSGVRHPAAEKRERERRSAVVKAVIGAAGVAILLLTFLLVKLLAS